MPLYDFKCTKCTDITERKIKAEDLKKQTCSKCKAPLEMVWLQTPALKGFNKYGSST